MKKGLKELKADYEAKKWEIEMHDLLRGAVYTLQDIRDELERLNSNLERKRHPASDQERRY